MNTGTFTNVHQFDGKIDIKLNKTFNNQEKLALITKIIYEFRNKNPNALKMLIIIKDTIIKNTKDNYDDTNNIDASDVLANILSGNNVTELYDLLEEQLVDMFTLGQCAQGRVGRLIQIYNIL